MHVFCFRNPQVRSMALWTFRHRVACVICVSEAGGRPVADAAKLARLKQILHSMLAVPQHQEDSALVEVEQAVHGPVHHERRLHQVCGLQLDQHQPEKMCS